MKDLYRDNTEYTGNMTSKVCKLQTFQQISKGAKTLKELPKTTKMVKASTLANPGEETLATNCTALLVNHSGQQYVVQPTAQVPDNATIVRDTQGAMVGIPMIAGGSSI